MDGGRWVLNCNWAEAAESDRMEPESKDSMSSQSEGVTENPSLNVHGKLNTGAWGIPHGSVAYHASSDASLFSSSLPVLPHEKLNYTDLENCGQCMDNGSPSLGQLCLGDEHTGTFEDDEPNTIGSLLPDDEDELLAGLMDDFDLSELPSQLEDLEEYDVFGSGGGMEMDFDFHESLSINMSKVGLSDVVSGNGIGHYGLPNGVGIVAGEHPYGEHPSRTLFVRNINSNVEDAELRTLFEQYGDIRTLYTACKHRGFVMISYYDIRAARTAMRALQNKPLRRRKLDIHFSIPKDNPPEKDINQGTLVVFNLDASVSNDELRQIFGAYGEVKEIRETPHKRHHKFIEFYDVRAAEAALRSLNRCDIAGKRIKLEPSRPGGARRNLMQQLSQELEQEDFHSFRHRVGSPVTNSPPGNWPHFSSPVEHNPLQALSRSPGLGTLSPINYNHLPGLASILPPHISSSTKIAPIGKNPGRVDCVNQILPNVKLTKGALNQHAHSYPDQKLCVSPGLISSFSDSNSTSSGIETLSVPQFLWGSPTQSERSSSSWTTSSVLQPFTSSGQRYGSLLSSQHYHVGSAPSGIPIDRGFGFFPLSPKMSYMGPGAFEGIHSTCNSGSYTMNMMSHGSAFPGNGSYPAPAGSEGLGDRARFRHIDHTGTQIDNKKQYQLELDRIASGDDTRTTLMIKNIPNKYTSKMLLAAIDENHKDTYDFLYLPIDFKNKCNVGYAFINMVSPLQIISFYEAFNGKKWEKFNSEKVASLAYARIQGKAALITHFQNSSLMNEDKRCRPILFHFKGQEIVDQEPFPSDNLNVCIDLPDGSHSGDSFESPK